MKEQKKSPAATYCEGGSKLEHFKTLIFTDERKNGIGKYAHLTGFEKRIHLDGSEIPKLMPMTSTMEKLKDFYLGVDFTGVELIEILLYAA